MAMVLELLVLSILVCKIQSQAIEVSTNLQYSQIPVSSYVQAQPPQSVSIAVQSPTQVPVNLIPQQYLTVQGPLTLFSPGPATIAAPPCSESAPVVLPSQPCPQPQNVIFTPPQTIFQSAPFPSFQVSPTPILPPPVVVSSPPQIAVQELPIPANIPAFIPQTPASIPMISTTVVDNSLANKLANVLQLFMISKTIQATANPSCNPPLSSDVKPLYDAIGSIGTVCGATEITAPFYAPTYGVTDILGVRDQIVTVTDLYPVTNIGTVSEVKSPYGDIYAYSPFGNDLLLPNQLVFNLPQFVDTGLDQIVYF